MLTDLKQSTVQITILKSFKVKYGKKEFPAICIWLPSAFFHIGWMKKSLVNEKVWPNRATAPSAPVVFLALASLPAAVSARNNWCVFCPQDCGVGGNLGVSVSLATNPAHPLIHNPEYPQPRQNAQFSKNSIVNCLRTRGKRNVYIKLNISKLKVWKRKQIEKNVPNTADGTINSGPKV